jgi:phosphatidylinositol alpha-mannosyltransferase
MKIAQVCPYNILRPGGVQSHILNLYKELRKRGHDVRIIAPGIDNAVHVPRDVILVGTSAELFLNKTQVELSTAYGRGKDALKLLLKKEKFDILHFHEPCMPTLSMQVLSESQSVNVATFHAKAVDTLVSKSIESLFWPIESHVIGSLDAIIAVSDVSAGYVRQFYKGDITIIPNGIDIKIFNPKNQPLKQYQNKKITILFVGRLDKRKGVLYLVKAFKKLRQKYKNIRLLLGGDGEEYKKIKKYIEKHSIPDVRLLGFVEEKDKPRLYATCDIFCSPALYGESFGIVLLEAMATGKPVVACSNPGYKTIMKGRASLFLAEPEDIDELAEKLELFCIDPGLRHFMGQWGIEEAKKYTWDKICSQVLEVYKTALHNKKKPMRRKKGFESKIKKWFESI